MKGPLRAVIGWSRYTTSNHPRGTFSYSIRLACGHTRGRKGSQGVPKRMRCSECCEKCQSF
jgi:hypothetical protein